MQDKLDHCYGQVWRQHRVLKYKYDDIWYCEYCSNNCLEDEYHYMSKFEFGSFVDCKCKGCADHEIQE